MPGPHHSGPQREVVGGPGALRGVSGGSRQLLCSDFHTCTDNHRQGWGVRVTGTVLTLCQAPGEGLHNCPVRWVPVLSLFLG